MRMHGLGDLQEVSALALKAGVDMDMVSEGFLATLKQSLAQGKVTQKEIDQACRRILEAKYKLGLFDDPYRYCNAERAQRELLSADKRQFARELAARSMVLLKNDAQTLPLKPGGTVALIGPMADNRPEMFGTWTIGGDPSHPVTVREGIAKAIGDQGKILYAKGANFTDDPEFLRRAFPWGGAPEESRSPGELLEEALTAARRSDVVVAVLGESSNMSGEAASRTRIGLPDNQLKLLHALHATGKPVVLVIFSGRPLTLTWEQEHLPAILMGWFGGIEAGNAIADVLYGAYNPAGKLTTTFPRSVGQIPLYYNHKPTGRPLNPNDKFTTKYLDESNEPLYPFGYGLSYTTFTYSDIRLSSTQLKGAGPLTAAVTVTNTGKFAGEEVVQLYISDPVASVSRAVKELKGFQKLMLAPGESREVQFSITPEQLKFYNSALQYDWESGEFGIQIGGNSRDVKQAKVVWTK
jgi:beta-glucosidase